MSNKMNTYDESQANANQRVTKINQDIDKRIEESSSELDDLQDYLNMAISVMQARFADSTDVGYALALARLLDLKLEATKKKTDLIKLRISDKATELAGTKKATDLGGAINDILSGVGVAVGMGVGLAANNANKKPAPRIIDAEQVVEVVETDTSDNKANDYIKTLVVTHTPD